MAGSAPSGIKKKNFSDLQQNLSTHVLKILLRRCDRKGRSCEESMSKNAKIYFGMLIIIVLVIYQEFLSPLFKLQALSFFWFGDLALKFGALTLGLVVASGWRLAMFVWVGLICIVVATGIWICVMYFMK